jgi:ADP-heptose:LPS heptosyltransferase
MQPKDDILNLLQESVDQLSRQTQRAIILQPGALGDCILTLPLANFLKQTLQLGSIDILGHSQCIGILPGRTCIDSVRSIDSTDLHRLFVAPNDLDLADRDPLINLFADYAWIVTFLGESNGNFEQNLIFTANCSHSAEVITLPLKPPEDFRQHLVEFYAQQFINQSGLSLELTAPQPPTTLIRATNADKCTGRQLLEEANADPAKKLIVIHPGSGGRHKCWQLGNFLALAKVLTAEGNQVVFLLGPAELERFIHTEFEDISEAGICMTDLSLAEVLAVLSCADAFIGNDSGISHLAAALGVKTMAIFGPTNPAVYKPLGPAVTIFEDTPTQFTEKLSSNLQQQILTALLD